MANIKCMPAVATAPMIRREIGDDHICLLTFDRPESGANIFDAATLDELNEHLDFVENDASLRGLIIASAKKSIFIAGADLKTLLQQAQSGEMREFIAKGQRIFDRLADLKIPTVAAIHGASAGGGYEVTLACDYRIASDDPATRMGLPETTLGLIPAWGGCTRLPRLIGVEKAAEVILKGQLYSAKEALRLGLVDEIAPRDQLLDRAGEKLRAGKRKVEGRAPATPGSRELALPSQRGNAAPERAYEIISKALSILPNESLQMELDAIVDLGKTEPTQNLIRNFFLAEKYKKGTPSRTATERVIHAAVIGAGVMGSGIAQWLSSRGVTVILRDIAREQIDRGLANIEKIYADAVKRSLMTEEKAKQGRARICGSTAPMELRDVRFVIEAASEKMNIKKEVFRELAMEAGPKTIVATNTSALPVSELADVTVSPEHVIGMHFFPGQSPFVSLLARCRGAFRERFGIRQDRQCVGAMGHADGAVEVDRRNRRRYHRRYWKHARKSLREARPRFRGPALVARPANAGPQNGRRFLQIRRQNAQTKRIARALATRTARRGRGRRGQQHSPKTFGAERRTADESTHLADGQRSRALRGGEGSRFAGGRGLRNDFGDGLRALPGRTITFRGAFRTEEGCRRIGTAGAKRGEIFGLRNFEKARARWDEVLCRVTATRTPISVMSSEVETSLILSERVERFLDFARNDRRMI